jgi:hypothetical protein
MPYSQKPTTGPRPETNSFHNPSPCFLNINLMRPFFKSPPTPSDFGDAQMLKQLAMESF